MDDIIQREGRGDEPLLPVFEVQISDAILPVFVVLFGVYITLVLYWSIREAVTMGG